jgi:hypothetical protein
MKTVSEFYAINDILVMQITSNTSRLYQIVDIKDNKLICLQINGKMTSQNEYCQSELIPNLNNFIETKKTSFKVVLDKHKWQSIGGIDYQKYYVYKYVKPIILDFYN